MKSKLIQLFFTSLLIYGAGCKLVAQENTILRTDTVLLGLYPGQAQMHYTSTSTDSFQLTKYEFKSELIKKITGNQLQLSELKVEGNINKSGWLQMYVQEQLHDIDLKGMRSGKVVDLEYQIDGHHLLANLMFDKEIPNGEWIFKERKITAGRAGTPEPKATIAFHAGIPMGYFSFTGNLEPFGEITLTGTLTNEGFLTDTLRIKYTEKQEAIIEERFYSNGFLLELRQYNDVGVISEFVSYDDVRLKLQNTNGGPNTYSISEKGFGIHFNPGYTQKDIRNTIQASGNRIFEGFVDFLVPFAQLPNSSHQLIFPLTRKFKFIYDTDENERLAYLHEKSKAVRQQTESFLNQPKIILRKSDIDSLAYAYAWVQHCKMKLDILDSHLAKINSSYFDYLNRNEYYVEGIPGIAQADTFSYKFGTEKKKALFLTGVSVRQPETLIADLSTYLDSIQKRLSIWNDESKRKIQAFEKQESIDSLDIEIVQFAMIVDSIYNKYSGWNVDSKSDNRPLAYKVIANARKRYLDEKKNLYLTADTYEKSMTRGERLLCNYKILSDYQKFEHINKMPRYWLDSLFTIYTENPFDARMFENKILPAVAQAGVRLHQHYLNKLFQASNCDELSSAIKNFYKLEEKMLFLRDNSNSDEVQFLNRVLRRETVAGRIERILEL
jgi:hypothetical protein